MFTICKFAGRIHFWPASLAPCGPMMTKARATWHVARVDFLHQLGQIHANGAASLSTQLTDERIRCNSQNYNRLPLMELLLLPPKVKDAAKPVQALAVLALIASGSLLQHFSQFLSQLTQPVNAAAAASWCYCCSTFAYSRHVCLECSFRVACQID